MVIRKDNDTICIEFGEQCKIITPSLFRWDKGQKLQFIDVPDETEVQFEGDVGCKYVTNGQVEIPDILLQFSEAEEMDNGEIVGHINAYVRIIAENSETTKKVLIIPVKNKSKPTDYVEPENEQTFRQYVEGVMNSTKAAAESAEEKVKTNEAVLQQIDEKTKSAVEEIAATRDTVVETVVNSGNEAIVEIGQTKTSAIDDINSAAEKHLENMKTYSDNAEKSASEADNTYKKIQDLEKSTTDKIETTGTEQISKVGAAGQEQIEAMKNVVAEVEADREQIQRNADDISVIAEDLSNMSNTLADGIICEASGELIHIEDASNKKIVSQKIFGKSVQDGTPTIEAPIDIVSAGEDGSIIEGVFGANLFDAHALNLYTNTSLDISEDGYTIVVTGGSKYAYSRSLIELPVELLKGKTIYFGRDELIDNGDVDVVGRNAPSLRITVDGVVSYTNLYSISSIKVDVPNNATKIEIAITTNNTNSVLDADNTVTVTGVRVTLDQNQPWTPYSGSQIVTLSTPNGLKGIPVTSGDNYTDANGQQWICDTIEKYADGTGKIIQRIGKEIVSGTPKFVETGQSNRFAWFGGLKTAFVSGEKNALSNFSPWSSWATASGSMTVTQRSLYYNSPTTMTVDEVNALFTELIASDNPPVVMGILATPIETELTAEELVELEKLHTYKPITNIMTDSDAGVEAEYVADTKTYIDNKFNELAVAMMATGSEV